MAFKWLCFLKYYKTCPDLEAKHRPTSVIRIHIFFSQHAAQLRHFQAKLFDHWIKTPITKSWFCACDDKPIEHFVEINLILFWTILRRLLYIDKTYVYERQEQHFKIGLYRVYPLYKKKFKKLYFVHYVTVWLVRIWTYKTLDKKELSFSWMKPTRPD